jgi:hypothetical protein
MLGAHARQRFALVRKRHREDSLLFNQEEVQDNDGEEGQFTCLHPGCGFTCVSDKESIQHQKLGHPMRFDTFVASSEEGEESKTPPGASSSSLKKIKRDEDVFLLYYYFIPLERYFFQFILG